jgi:hypothetical protein
VARQQEAPDREASPANGRSHLAETGGRLISLFFGSGQIERAVGACILGADASPELLQLYADLQEFPLSAARDAARLSPQPIVHARVVPGGSGPVARSARAPPEHSPLPLAFVALAFNGVWRVNAAGEMNMPPDPARLKRGLDALPPLEAFQRFAEEIRGITFVNGWQTAFIAARPGDVSFAILRTGNSTVTPPTASGRATTGSSPALKQAVSRTASASSPSTLRRRRPSTTGRSARRSRSSGCRLEQGHRARSGLRAHHHRGAQAVTQALILTGDLRTLLPKLELASFDVCIADPPYGETNCAWDRRVPGWPALVRRLLKPHGSLWVFGSLRCHIGGAA